MMKKKNAKSFKRELIFSFLTIGITSILILGSFQVFQLRYLIEEKENYQVLSTTFTEDYISNYVDTHKQIIDTMANHISYEFSNEDYDLIEQKLMEVKNNYPGFVNLYVGDNTGESLLFYPDALTDGLLQENYNFSDREYYQKLIENETSIISPVFHGRGGTDLLLVAIVSPIFDNNGEMQGYVLGALDLNELDKYTASRISDETSRVIIVDQDNNVIVHPDIDTEKELVNLSDSEIIQQIEKNGNTGSFTFDNGDKQFITHKKIEALGWTVWISNPTIAITGPFIDSIFAVFVMVIITGIILILTSLFLTNRLENAILNLLQYIKRYTNTYKNNESIELVEEIHGPTEMNELLIHFNEMMQEIDINRAELIELNKELEVRVQERTANLENKNTELRAVNKLITSVSAEKDMAQFIQLSLKNIGKHADNRFHILFDDFAITSNRILENQRIEDYLSQYITSKDPQIEPIHFGKEIQGYLVIDEDKEQATKPGEGEFLETFSRSLAIMLENKLLFERFRFKHAELDAVLGSMFEGIMLLDNENQIKYVNEFFLQVISGSLSHQHELPVLRTLEDVYKQFIKYFEVEVEELSKFLKYNGGELRLKYKQNSRKETHFLLHNFLVESDGNNIGSGLLIQDITKEVEIDTLKNNLISLTSHEFKTPITNIKGSVETLLREDVEWEAEFQLELLEGVLEDIDRIRNLVNDWMDISKIESGSMYIDRNIIRPVHVIEESLKMVPKLLQENAIFTFKNEAEEDLLFYADKGRVQQVLLNLFTNALRYNDSKNRKIDIVLKKETDYVTISIADNGIGIATEHLKSIFNRFYQVDVTATRRSGGTGLGLAICEGIMEAHAGRIEVESRLDEGSRFTLYFPIDSPSQL